MKTIRQIRDAFNVGVLAALLAVVTLSNQPFAMAADNVNKDWVLKVQTEELQRQFDYKGSNLKAVAKVTVGFYHESDPDNVKPYELVYYHGGKPIGMKRTGELNLPLAQIVAIKVSHKSTAGIEEAKATANILWRLGLNVTHKHDALVSTILPASSFDKITKELESIGFQTAKASGEWEANSAKALLALESEPSGMTKKLYFY